MEQFVVTEPSLTDWTVALTRRGERACLRAVYRSPCGGRVHVTLRCLVRAVPHDRLSLTLHAGSTGAELSFSAHELQFVDAALEATSALVDQVLDGDRFTVMPVRACAVAPRSHAA